MKLKNLLFISLLFLVHILFAQIPTNGLVVDYPFNGNAQDQSAGAHHATVHNAILTTDRFGIANAAYRFSGTNSYLEAADHNDFSVTTTNQLSISVWQKPAAFDFKNHEDGYVHWMGKGETGQHEYTYRMYNKTFLPGDVRPQRVSAYIFNLSGGLGTGSYVQEANDTITWNHYCIFYNTTTGLTKLYKNGVLKDTDLYSDYNIVPGNGTAPFRIGTRDLNSFFQGCIDDIKIYNRELSATEVNNLYKAAVTTSVDDDDKSLENKLKLYPNPSSGSFYYVIPGDALTVNTIEIFDAVGNKAYQLLNAPNERIVSAADLNAGVYFFRISNDVSVEIQRFVVVSP